MILFFPHGVMCIGGILSYFISLSQNFIFLGTRMVLYLPFFGIIPLLLGLESINATHLK